MDIGHALILSSHDDGSEEWHAQRSRGIGGSEAACVLGMKPYGKSRLDLWAEKTGRSESRFTGNSATEYGSTMEEHIFSRLMFDHGLQIQECPHQMAHPDHPWMLGNADGLIVEDGEAVGIVEIKTSGEPLKGDEPHPYHYAQVQHYLAVTGLHKAIYAYHVTPMDRVLALYTAQEFIEEDRRHDFFAHLAMVGDLQVLTIERDEQYIEKLITHESAFWDAVCMDVEPEPLLPEGDIESQDAALVRLIEDYARVDHQVKSYKAPTDIEKQKKKLLEKVRQQCDVMVGVAGAKRIHTPAGVVTWNARGYWQVKAHAPKESTAEIEVPF